MLSRKTPKPSQKCNAEDKAVQSCNFWILPRLWGSGVLLSLARGSFLCYTLTGRNNPMKTENQALSLNVFTIVKILKDRERTRNFRFLHQNSMVREAFHNMQAVGSISPVPEGIQVCVSPVSKTTITTTITMSWMHFVTETVPLHYKNQYREKGKREKAWGWVIPDGHLARGRLVSAA